MQSAIIHLIVKLKKTSNLTLLVKLEIIYYKNLYIILS
nr:MAG TPA: hypothetical protein [Bacteriophage sp.]